MVTGMTKHEERRVLDYSVMTERQIQEDRKRIDQVGHNVAGLYRIMEKENTKHIGELHLDIGVMRAVLERFPDDDHIRQMAEYFIRVDMNLIENLTEEIEYGRTTAEEFERIRRG